MRQALAQVLLGVWHADVPCASWVVSVTTVIFDAYHYRLHQDAS